MPLSVNARTTSWGGLGPHDFHRASTDCPNTTR